MAIRILVTVLSLAAASAILFRAYGQPQRLHVPIGVAWLVAALVAFAPILAFVDERNRPRAWLASAIFFSLLSVLLCWAAFGPGDRVFTGGSGFGAGPVSASREGVSEVEGRTFFGMFAIACLFGTGWLWRRWYQARFPLPGADDTKPSAHGGWHRKRKSRAIRARRTRVGM